MAMMMNDNELNENQVDYECFMKIIKFIIHSHHSCDFGMVAVVTTADELHVQHKF